MTSVLIRSWNVLAGSYMPRDRYPDIDDNMFDQTARRRRICDIITEHPDTIWALQEVEGDLVETFDQQLGDTHHVLWAPKSGGRPDGCATIVPRKHRVRSHRTLTYHDSDDSSHSGHVAEIVDLGTWTLANTHLRWSAPGDDHLGRRQLTELNKYLPRTAIIAADTNDTPNGPGRHLLRTLGFHETQHSDATAVVDGSAVAIDIIAGRNVTVRTQPHLWHHSTTLRLDGCPSDHVAVGAIVDASDLHHPQRP